MRRQGWLVVDVDDRSLGIVISVTDAGKPFLSVAGFHLGETMFVGERQERLSIKVEKIAERNAAQDSGGSSARAARVADWIPIVC